MTKKHFWLSFIFIVIIVVMFILPELTPDRFDRLILMYATKDELLGDVATGKKGLASMKYLFKLDIYLEILSKIVAAASLVGLLYQFKRDKNINEAEFVLNINNSFITNERLMDVYKQLETCKSNDQQTNPFTEEDVINVANYLSFFEPFYALVTQKVVNFSSIDQLAYRFFLAVNNRYVQEMLLCKEHKEIAWKDLYKLHHAWKQYRTRKNDFEIWQKEYDLSQCPRYKDIIADRPVA
ncbi:MAG: hypothetical protein GF313_10325 [Caldithrix sp.]|nr:hypothetical protein [Caldithrix sp.]